MQIYSCSPLSPALRALILLCLSEIFSFQNLFLHFKLYLFKLEKTSEQIIQLDKTNILLSHLLILDKYILSSGKIYT